MPAPRLSPFCRPLLLLSLLVSVSACDEEGGGVLVVNPPDSAEVAVVLNSIDVSLTIFPVDTPSAAVTLGLGPEGSPVGLSVRGHVAAVPLGLVPAVAIVDLEEARVTHTVALPPGSGATGSAFANDSVVIVANPGLGTVTPVNVLRGTAGTEIPVGTFPQGVVATERWIFVLNGELGADFLPRGPATLSVLDPDNLAVINTLELSGENAGFGVAASDGTVYVVNQGRFAGGNGSLSVVDGDGADEVGHHPGFGDFPGSLALGSDGRLYVSSFSFGVAVWDPAARAFDRGPDDAIEPDGLASSSGVGIDANGRLYSLTPECLQPATVNRLDAAYEVEARIPVGTCPIDIAFAYVVRP